MLRTTSSALALSLMLAASTPAMSNQPPAKAPASPPTTPVRTVTDTVHGQQITDDYRWLEGETSDPAQMGKVTDEVSAWTDQQNAYTRSVLDNLPGRKALEDQMRPLMEIGSVSAPIMRGPWYFYTKREGKENQPKVYVRMTGPDGKPTPPRVLIDPAQIDPSGLTALGGIFPSQNGAAVGIGLYRAGDENTTIYVIETATGRWLNEEVPGKASIIEWLPDHSGFFYRCLGDVKNPYSGQIRLHRLGTHPKGDPLLFRQYTPQENAKLATTWGPGADVSRDGKWMVLTYWTGTSSNDIWVIDLDKWRADGKFEMREVKVGAPATFGGFVIDSTLYMLTDYKATNRRLVAIDLNSAKLDDESTWKTIIPENPGAVLTNVGEAGPMLAADYEEKASSRIRLFARDGAPKGELRLPGIGSANISVAHDRTEAYLSFTSFNSPPTIYKVDVAKPDAEPTVWERPDVPVDPSTVEVKQVTYKSKDGTPVTMFVVHKKGLKLDGTNPTILTGYGGFNISETPFFSATLFPFLDRGGVLANPNLRGGGEYGKAWHEGGMLDKKQNVFDDFYAAAQWLIDNKYTNPSKLAIVGGSNGGLLTGTAVTQRPDLFAAAIVAVPLLDMLRYQNFLMARYWVPEYGDPADEKAFAWLKAYSPYHNINKGTKYPAVFLTAGENDTRVHAMHARKMAAALQAATAQTPGAKPVLLWVDRDAGHGAGKPLNLRLRDAVDSRIFVMWQLGMLESAN